MKYQIQNWKARLACLFSPRQRWLTKKIPNTYVNKPDLLELVAFESVIHFVEVEGGLGGDMNPSDPKLKQIKIVYDYLKKGRLALVKIVGRTTSDFSIVGEMTEEDEKQVKIIHQVEKALSQGDKMAFGIIVRNYKSLEI